MIPQPGSACTVCHHPQAHQINLELAAGQAKMGVGKRYGLGRGAVNRHVASGHVPIAATSTPSTSAPASLDIDPVAALQKRLNTLHETSTDGWSPAQVDRHNEQIRRTAESLSRMKPPTDTEGPAVKALKALQEIVAVQMEVIERYPEVRKEISEALQAWKHARTEAVT